MVFYLSFLYLFFGFIFLLIPLLYIELGRPRDFIKASINLIIGMLLLIKNNVFGRLYSSILIALSILLIFYLVEIFSIRWNQLTHLEKNKLKTVVEFKKNVATLKEAISLARKDFFNSKNFLKFTRNNDNINKKEWVRNGENDSIDNSNQKNFKVVEMSKKATIQSKKDTIKKEKN